LSFYIWVVRDHQNLAAIAAAAVRERLGEGLHPRVALQLSPPWMLAEILRDGPPVPTLRTLALVTGDRRGRILTDDGYDAGVRDRDSSLHRGAVFYPGDLVAPLLSKRLGGVLALAHSDAPPDAYAARFIRGRCVGSIYLRDRERLVRFDGVGLRSIDEPGVIPEGDRAGVLLGGLSRFTGEPLRADHDEQVTLADVLGWGPEEGEPIPLEI